MINQINLIQFYDSPEKSDYFTQIATSNLSNLKAVLVSIKDKYLPPFQINLGAEMLANFVFTVWHVNLETGLEVDITGSLGATKFKIGTTSYLQTDSYKLVDRTIKGGLFNLKIRCYDETNDIEVFRYSDVMCWGLNYNSWAKLTYSSDKQIGEAIYQTNFFNSAYVRAEIEQSEPEITEELKIHNDVELPVQTILIPKITVKILCSDSMRSALMSLISHENVSLETELRTYNTVKRCSVTSSYLPSMNMHEVAISLPYDVTVWRESTINDTITDLTVLNSFNNDFNDDFK